MVDSGTANHVIYPGKRFWSVDCIFYAKYKCSLTDPYQFLLDDVQYNSTLKHAKVGWLPLVEGKGSRGLLNNIWSGDMEAVHHDGKPNVIVRSLLVFEPLCLSGIGHQTAILYILQNMVPVDEKNTLPTIKPHVSPSFHSINKPDGSVCLYKIHQAI